MPWYNSIMDKKELVLAAMSAAEGGKFTPVQVQKLFFLLDDKVGAQIGGPHFSFRPYHYGPFDASVYQTIEGLASEGLALISTGASFRMRHFSLTASGQEKGLQELTRLGIPEQSFIKRTCKFVRETPFAELVSAVYRAYPNMKVNSVFHEAR
jgi:hypothetical protein